MDQINFRHRRSLGIAGSDIAEVFLECRLKPCYEGSKSQNTAKGVEASVSIAAKQAFYIKLGRGGGWESECLREGTLRFGYRGTPHDLCIAGKWDQVREFWTHRKGHAGTGTSFARQIRTFYETDETALFITFANGLLYWCRPTGPVEMLTDGNRRRATVDGWHSRSVKGTPLTSDRISGHLLKV